MALCSSRSVAMIRICLTPSANTRLVSRYHIIPAKNFRWNLLSDWSRCRSCYPGRPRPDDSWPPLPDRASQGQPWAILTDSIALLLKFWAGVYWISRKDGHEIPSKEDALAIAKQYGELDDHWTVNSRFQALNGLQGLHPGFFVQYTFYENGRDAQSVCF